VTTHRPRRRDGGAVRAVGDERAEVLAHHRRAGPRRGCGKPAATGAARAAQAFEDEFEDARDVAARGMTITGQDAA
jgi:hypothetical protein